MPEDIAGPVLQASSLVRKISESPHSCFFYPAGLPDRLPLGYFADLCDTFIYCDVAFRPEGLIGQLQAMMAQAGAELAIQGSGDEIAVEGQLGLAIDERPDWLRRYVAPNYLAQYDEAVQIVKNHGGPSGRKVECRIAGKLISLYFFCAEAGQCYAALFSRQNAAPKAVCLKQPNPGQRRFVGIDDWDGPLGRAVADSPQPELLVTGAVRADDWPWNTEWRRFDNGQLVAYRRQHRAGTWS